MENNRVEGYRLKPIEFYDSSMQYGGTLERITIIIEYSLLVQMLKKCPVTDDYKLLLSVLKGVKKADKLEEELSKELTGYSEVDGAVLWSEETGWKDNKFGFLVFDTQGKCEKLSLWISYPLALDLVFNWGDKEIIQDLIDTPKTESLTKLLKERLDSEGKV